jgi:hypothetical protein
MIGARHQRRDAMLRARLRNQRMIRHYKHALRLSKRRALRHAHDHGETANIKQRLVRQTRGSHAGGN